MVTSATHEVIARNDLAAAPMEDFSALPRRDRNLVRRVSDRDQRVVIYTAAPGSPSEEALRLLAVIGTQRMDVTR